MAWRRCRVFWSLVFAWHLGACRRPPEILAPPQPAVGQHSIVESGGPGKDTGWWPQIALDGNGVAHIAYCDAALGDVRYGRQSPDGWTLETVAHKGKTGKYISLALHPDGTVGLTYYDQSTHYFDYAWRRGTSGPWQTEHIAWGLEAGMASALRYTPDGVAHVAYYLAEGKLVHAQRAAAGGWRKEILGDYQAVYSSQIGALVHGDALWLSYVDWRMDAAKLYFAALTASGWQHGLVPAPAGSGWRSQLAAVADDVWLVHSSAMTADTQLSLRTPDGAWRSVPLVRGGSSFAVAADHNRGVLAFARHTPQERGLYLAVQAADGPWPVQLIDREVGTDPAMALAISPSGQLWLVYYSAALHGLKAYTQQLPEQPHPTR